MGSMHRIVVLVFRLCCFQAWSNQRTNPCFFARVVVLTLMSITSVSAVLQVGGPALPRQPSKLATTESQPLDTGPGYTVEALTVSLRIYARDWFILLSRIMSVSLRTFVLECLSCHWMLGWRHQVSMAWLLPNNILSYYSHVHLLKQEYATATGCFSGITPRSKILWLHNAATAQHNVNDWENSGAASWKHPWFNQGGSNVLAVVLVAVQDTH